MPITITNIHLNEDLFWKLHDLFYFLTARIWNMNNIYIFEVIFISDFNPCICTYVQLKLIACKTFSWWLSLVNVFERLNPSGFERSDCMNIQLFECIAFDRLNVALHESVTFNCEQIVINECVVHAIDFKPCTMYMSFDAEILNISFLVGK